MDQGDLERSFDPSRVRALDRSRQRRCEAFQTLVGALQAIGREVGADLRPDRGVGRQAGRIEPLHDRAQVEPGAPGQDRHAIPRVERGQDIRDVGVEGRDGEDLVGIDEIEPVVDDPGPVLGGGLGRADVQPAIDLPGVGGDDLGVTAVGQERLGQRDRQAGLAGGGRAAEDDERRRHAPTIVPRNAYGPACSTRAATIRPTSDGSPATWMSLCSRVRPFSATPTVRSRRPRLVVVAARRRHGVDEHVHLAPDPGLVSCEPDPFLQGEQDVEPPLLLGDRHVVGEVRRRRPRPDRVGRGEDLVVPDRLEQRQRRFELGLGLAAEPHDDVRGDRDSGHGRADRRQALEVVLDRVLAAHPPKDGVVARLDRQVEVLADRRAVGHRRDQAVGEVPRMRRDESEPRDPEPVDGPDEFGQVRTTFKVEPSAGPAVRVDMPEPRLRRKVMPVRIDVLAQQGDLPVARVGELAPPRRRCRRTGGYARARG